MTFDAGRGRVVLFGGFASPTFFDDIWEWDGTVWSGPLRPSPRPPPRSEHGLAYDEARGRVVLFGGSGQGGARFDDVWEWNGSSWSGPLTPALRPSARRGHALTYDAARERIILFGGNDGVFVTEHDDLWAWNGTTWSGPFTPSPRPTPRNNHALAYDRARERVVLFGGSGGGLQSDVWEWDGAAWSGPRSPTTRPDGRHLHGLAYDEARERVVLFGGNDGALKNDVWDWDGEAWLEVSPSPGPSERSRHAVTYDGTRGRVITFGGFAGARFNDLWELDHDASRAPAIQLAASLSSLGVDAQNVAGVHVRAHCGGSSLQQGVQAPGAVLVGWFVGGPPTSPPGSWRLLAVNDANVVLTPGGPAMAPPPAALMDWTAANQSEAQHLLSEGGREIHVQCRVAGDSGAGRAAVGLDFIEVRVRYQTTAVQP